MKFKELYNYIKSLVIVKKESIMTCQQLYVYSGVLIKVGVIGITYYDNIYSLLRNTCCNNEYCCKNTCVGHDCFRN